MRRVKKSRNAKLGPKRRVSKGRKLIGRRRVRARRVVSAVMLEQQALEYNKAYDKGFDEAYNEGFNVGYTEGMNTGHQEAN